MARFGARTAVPRPALEQRPLPAAPRSVTSSSQEGSPTSLQQKNKKQNKKQYHNKQQISCTNDVHDMIHIMHKTARLLQLILQGSVIGVNIGDLGDI